MSTIPDGRLKYALFDGETGEPAKWANEFAPKACVRCHDKTNTVEKVP